MVEPYRFEPEHVAGVLNDQDEDDSLQDENSGVRKTAKLHLVYLRENVISKRHLESVFVA